MPQDATDAAAAPAVEGVLKYIVPGDRKPATYVTPPGARSFRRTAQFAEHRVPIHDGRPLADTLTLDREGVAFTRHETKVEDFYDEEEVKRVYYPEMAALVKEVTGASKVVVFDHTVRADAAETREARQTREPVRVVHNDYTPKSGPQRVRDLLPADEAEAWLRGRFAVINVWRPIRGPVETVPLAICDARSIADGDLIATDLVYAERAGEIYQTAFNADHRWYYFPRMARDEVALIKCYDSAEDGTARFTAHTAFDDPTSPADAAPRESIEIRTLVLY